LHTLLDGNRVRDQILEELRPRVQRVTERLGRPPGLAVILVGENAASEVYVRNKTRTAAALGIYSETLTPGGDVQTAELLQMVERLNVRPEIDGILVQLPLPSAVDSQRVLLAVSPAKDVDGFHPVNVGNLSTGRPGPRPCTPAGIIELLSRYEIPMAGKRAVVVGRSDIVGKPVAMLLLQQNATVTIAHSKTAQLPELCREAEILVAAIGRPAFLGAEHISPGTTVIDVGINRITNRSEVIHLFGEGSARLKTFDEKGSVLVGDVHPVEGANAAGAWTPVPGGVGPLTIALLMRNTVDAAELAVL
jgi:methylenetetrahydrofolate dehydrogenase (NADP+)/methenyltetrahydrofolate cyclohydrolase